MAVLIARVESRRHHEHTAEPDQHAIQPSSAGPAKSAVHVKPKGIGAGARHLAASLRRHRENPPTMASTASPPDSSVPPAHLMQLYEADARALLENVAKYLQDGLKAGCGVLVVATTDHKAGFIAELTRLGESPDRAIRTAQPAFLDADETLARFMLNGHPDADRFDRSVGEAVRRAHARAAGKGLLAYGDMVGVLWRQKQFPAAIRLEQLWNRLQKSLNFQLFCGYPIDIFDRTFDIGVIDALLCAHTHLLPTRSNAGLET